MTPERKRLALLFAALAGAAVWSFWPRDEAPTPNAGNAGPQKRGKAAVVISYDDIPGPPKDPAAELAGIAKVNRNVFAFFVPTPTNPPIPTPTKTPIPGERERGFIGPSHPTPTPTNTPIVPPAIPYTVVAVFGPKEKPIVAFEEGGRIINAREGDVLDGKFILLKINQESVDWGFKDLPREITRRMPLGTSVSR